MDRTDTPRFEAMTTGTLLDRAFRLYTNNFRLMLGITASGLRAVLFDHAHARVEFRHQRPPDPAAVCRRCCFSSFSIRPLGEALRFRLPVAPPPTRSANGT